MKSIGERIAQLRREHNMTQAMLGAKLNISAQAVSKWEKGLSEPDIETIKKLCMLFKITVDELTEFNGDGGNESPKPTVATTTKVMLGECDRCHKPLYSRNDYVEQGDQIICKDCIKNQRQANAELAKKQNKKSLIWSLVVGALAFIAVLVGFLIAEQEIYMAIISSVAIFAFVSQLFWDGVIVDIIGFFIRSFRLPMLIFELSLDGIIWFILVKLGLYILSGIVSVLWFLLGIVVTSVISLFTFPFSLVRFIKEMKEF